MEQIGYLFIDTFKYGLPYAILALGVFISYRQLDIADLGCEGTFTLGGAVVAVLIFRDVNPYLALLIALLCGFLAGSFTGFLHTILKIPALLSGIITLTGLFAVNMSIMGLGTSPATAFNSVAYLTPNRLTASGNKTIETVYTLFQKLFARIGLNIPTNWCIIIVSLMIAAILLIVLYYFFGTELGMSIRACGMNQKMSRAQGINTNLMIILGLGISNALISTSGAMMAQITRSANNTMGVGMIVTGLAAIIIGELLFGKKTFKNWLISVALGGILYYFIIALAITLKFPSHLLRLLYAALITIVLGLGLIKKKIALKKSKNINNHPLINNVVKEEENA